MLNPEFRWCDPDPEQLSRLASLSPQSPQPDGRAGLADLHPDQLREVLRTAEQRLAVPGVHPEAAVELALREAARSQGIGMPEPAFYQWPQGLLNWFLEGFQEPHVLLLGILDAEGIWAGIIAGVANGGLDFLTTTHWLWLDQPELASRQRIADIHELTPLAARRFNRPAAGLFIYRNEFLEWRDRGWPRDLLEYFLQRQTAAHHFAGCTP